MDRGRPTRLSSKSGCGGRKDGESLAPQVTGSWGTCPPSCCPSSSWAGGGPWGRAERNNSLAGGAEGLVG